MTKPMVPEVHHLAYVARDIDRSIRLWQAAAGAEVEMPRTRMAADNVDVCFLVFPGGRVELVQPCDPDEAARRDREAAGHPDHVCFVCDDFEQRVAGARDQGGIVVRGPVASEAFGKRMCFVLYPAMGLVEWVER